MSSATIEQPDIAVFAPDGNLQLVVEVKSRRGVDAEWAIALRRNLYADALLPDAPYFLLASPERLFLWKRSGEAGIADAPAYEISASPVLAPYFGEIRAHLDHISGYGFEMIVAAWLTDVINSDAPPKEHPHAQWLIESGLYEIIKNGRVQFGVRA